MILTVKATEEGELYFDTPEEMIKELDFKEGDILTWTLNDDGSVTLTKSDMR